MLAKSVLLNSQYARSTPVNRLGIKLFILWIFGFLAKTNTENAAMDLN
jgi:hypothetical protein